MKRIFPIRTLFVAALAAALLTGCFKDVSYKTTYVLKPLMQRVSGDLLEPVEGASAYAFDADTAAWFVASYDDALSGVISLRSDPAQKRSDPTAVAEPDETFEGRLRMKLGLRSQMVVAVDPVNRLYAYTQQKNAANLPYTYVTLLFRPYRQGTTYRDGNWIFGNDFYTPPVYLDCYLAPRLQEEEGGAAVDFPASTSAVKAYAFAADTTLWYIASYQDAADGIITSKLDKTQQRDAPNFTAFVEDDMLRMTVSDPTLMVVVVDRNSLMYAYSKQTVDLGGASPTFSVVFRPWMKRYLYVDEGWRVVDDTYKPEDPDPLDPDNPQSLLKRANR